MVNEKQKIIKPPCFIWLPIDALSDHSEARDELLHHGSPYAWEEISKLCKQLVFNNG
jgi:hypothetical protein